MIRAILIILIFSSSALAAGIKYWEIEIPVVKVATKISNERDERFYIISTSYRVEISNTQKIYEFYSSFFQKIGWENPMKDFPRGENEYQGKWHSYRSTFNDEGFPESSYASTWKANDFSATGTVLLTLTGFRDEKFNAKVEIILSPEVDTTPIFQLQKIMMGDPKNIFILHEATGGNPFEIDKVNPQPTEKFKDNEMVKEYYEMIDTILKQYNDFATKYIK